ncbi:MAG TPA: hypothetical protein VFQ68_43255 [Streptosporangiaceae bacterium]|nr:hypothetical protein [Streptosporangiaceae bacterium]
MSGLTETTKAIAPNGVLRAAIDLGNPVLAQGTPAAPAGVTVDIARELGVRIGVNEGSAYDLFLSRTLEKASLVRSDDGIALFREQGLEAAAGIRQVITAFVAENPEFRLVDQGFMQIRQALGTTLTRTPDTIRFLAAFIEDLKASGFIAAALRSGQDAALFAPPAPPAPPAASAPPAPSA